MGSNKRIDVRVNCLVPVRFSYGDDGKIFYARMVNYGNGGACLTTRAPIMPESRLQLTLEAYSPDGSTLGAFERYNVEVCWSKQVDERGLPVYEAGVRYCDQTQ